MASARKRSLHVVVQVLAVAMMLLIASAPATAVHDLGVLQLDGNITDADATTDPQDWGVLFDSSGNPIIANMPAGYQDDVFDKDFIPGSATDDSYHEPSNKDDQAISASGGSGVWGCTTAANATDKNDLVNAYAIAAIKDVGGTPHQLLLFGVERFDNSGDAFIGVWFFQSEVGCDTSLGKFTGQKTTNDLLLLVNFINGGADAQIKTYRWVAGATSTSPGTLDLLGTNSACGTTTSDSFCAVTNTTNSVTPPWPITDKKKPGGPSANPANTHEPFQFFEGGIDVTAVLGSSAPLCLSSFMAETRSSSSIDATLKDFAGGSLDTCGDIPVHKYHDRDADGTDDGSGEEGLAGWKIFIDGNGDETLQTEDTDCDGLLDAGEDANINGKLDGEQCRTTDSAGDALFENLPGGTYSVCEVLTSGWFNSDPAGTTLCENANVVSQATSAAATFGNYTTGNVSGIKFFDHNGDGTRTAAGDDGVAGTDDDEVLLDGWTIRVYADIDGDGELEPDGDDGTPGNSDDETLVDSTTTLVDDAATTDVDETGTYSFELAPGDYIICEVMQSGWAQKYPTASTTGTADCSAVAGLGAQGWAVTIGSGDDITGKSFGNALLHRIIVLVCHESDDSLVAADVTVDGSTETTLGPGDGGTLSDDDLCDLGGASFGGKVHETESLSVDVPASGTDSGH